MRTQRLWLHGARSKQQIKRRNKLRHKQQRQRDKRRNKQREMQQLLLQMLRIVWMPHLCTQARNGNELSLQYAPLLRFKPVRRKFEFTRRTFRVCRQVKIQMNNPIRRISIAISRYGKTQLSALIKRTRQLLHREQSLHRKTVHCRKTPLYHSV
jgi:hypothetical protein